MTTGSDTQRGQASERAVLRRALLALAVSTDASVVGEDGDGWDEEIQALFDCGLIRLQRDFADEYLTVLTASGRDFIRNALDREFGAPDAR